MKTLIEAFNGIDIISFAVGGLFAFLIQLVHLIFLELFALWKEKKK